MQIPNNWLTFLYLRISGSMSKKEHTHGHIVDLVISCDDDNLIKGVSASSMVSDHFLVNINVSLHKQSVSAKVISYRKYKSIDKESFLADLLVSSLVLDPPDDVDQLVDLWWISVIVHCR